MAKAKKQTKAKQSTPTKSKAAKAAKSPKTTKAPKQSAGSARGTRYSAKQKAAILAFVDKHNAKNGRGGAAEASRKYGITQLTISKWMKDAGAPSPSRKNTADFNKTIKRITEVHKEMAVLHEKLDTLRKEYAELKSVL